MIRIILLTVVASLSLLFTSCSNCCDSNGPGTPLPSIDTSHKKTSGS